MTPPQHSLQRLRTVFDPEKNRDAISTYFCLLEVAFDANRVTDLQVGRECSRPVEPPDSRRSGCDDRIPISVKPDCDSDVLHVVMDSVIGDRDFTNLAFESYRVVAALESGCPVRTIERTNVCHRGRGQGRRQKNRNER